MKVRRVFVLSMGLAVIGAACRMQDMREVQIRVPGMRCERCAQQVTDALRKLEGVRLDSVEADGEQGLVFLRYDSMRVARKNLEHAIADAGFDVDTKPLPLPANAAAREALPEACREHLD